MSEEETTVVGAKKGEAWTLTGFGGPSKRKTSRKEQQAIEQNAQTVVAIDTVPVQPELLIPLHLTTTKDDMFGRVHFDVPRLLCIAKQYPRSCGVTSLTSVWNSLYSVLGHGSLPPVSQEEVMTILGFQPPFDQIRWGPFTGNVTLLRWFHTINRSKGVQGKAYVLWKAHGHGRTIGVDAAEGQRRLVEALRSPQSAVVYHCHNHYMVPIGFQWIPRRQFDCYRPNVKDEDCEMTVFIGEVSRGKHPAIHVKKWSDIALDIQTVLPQYVNIRASEVAVMTRSKKKAKVETETGEEEATSTATAAAADVPSKLSKVGNLHCLLCFRSDVFEEDIGQFMEDEAAEGMEELELADDAE